VADTVRATEGVPPAVEEASAAVVAAAVVTRYASLSSLDTQAVSRPVLPFTPLTLHTSRFVPRVSWLADNALVEPFLLRRHVT